MKNQFLFSLHKFNNMKYLILLFCSLSTAAFAQSSRKNNKSRSQESVAFVNTPQTSNADLILQVILTDFATNFETLDKPSTIILLDSYNQLVDKRFTVNGINFISGGKPEILLNNGVSIAFWRLDISETKAHIEFYYTDSKKQTTHHEYLLNKENAVWRK